MSSHLSLQREQQLSPGSIHGPSPDHNAHRQASVPVDFFISRSSGHTSSTADTLPELETPSNNNSSSSSSSSNTQSSSSPALSSTPALRLRLRVVARLFGLSLCVLTGAADEQAMAMFLALDLTTKAGMAYAHKATYTHKRRVHQMQTLAPTSGSELEAKHKEQSSRMSNLVKSMFAPYGAGPVGCRLGPAAPVRPGQQHNACVWAGQPCIWWRAHNAVTPGGAASTTLGPSQGSARETPAPARQRKRWLTPQEPASATASTPGPAKSVSSASSSSNAADAGPAPRAQRKLRVCRRRLSA
ncbi:hypothetical protein COO60DRAFT_1628831 [Scenedesmus sp. NREL 46B-D3]|nr:hypothetical protein COO60DRAFT_1628831 [Scenedesmus sp. NREL 46B-D3]